MATKTTQSAANDIQSLFDPKGYQDAFQTWARMTGMMVDAAARTTVIASGTTQDALSNLRAVTPMRDEPTDYGQAYSDFVQKQTELFTRTA